MGDFKKSNRFGGGNRFGKKSFGKPNFERRGGGRDREMFDAVCSKCGKDCQLPFRPDGRKPVFCKDCFGNQNNDSMTFPTHNNFEKRDFSPAPAFKAPAQDNRALDEIKRQLDTVTTKLDMIVKAMESMKPQPAPAIPAKEASKPMIASAKTKAVAKKSTPAKKAVAKKKK